MFKVVSVVPGRVGVVVDAVKLLRISSQIVERMNNLKESFDVRTKLRRNDSFHVRKRHSLQKYKNDHFFNKIDNSNLNITLGSVIWGLG